MTAVAHVSYPGGGIFLPDHGPGDRQTIVEYVARLLRSKEKVQILVDSQRWLAQSGNHACCARCRLVSATACRETSHERDVYCLRCALAIAPKRANPHNQVAQRHLTLASARA